MGRYDAQQIIRNVEQQLKHATARAEEHAQQTPHHSAGRAAMSTAALLPPTWQIFNESILPELGRHNAVNKVPPGSRFAFLKKVFLRAMRPIVGPQAVVNAQSLRGFELLANHIDAMQKRMVEVEEWYARELAAAHDRARHAEAEASEARELARLVHEAAELASEETLHLEGRLDFLEGELRTADEKAAERDRRLRARLVDLARRLARVEAGHSGLRARVLTLSRAHASLGDSVAARLDATESALSATTIELGGSIDDLRADFERSQADLTEAGRALASLRGELDSLRGEAEAVLNATQVREDDMAEMREQIESLDFLARATMLPAASETGWVPAAFKAMENRIGAAEASVRESQARLMQGIEYRSLVEDLLARIPASDATVVAPREHPASPTLADALRDDAEALAYVRFQRQFRGDEATLRERQRQYVDLIRRHLAGKPLLRLLDVACGDGVFLDLARAMGWNVEGVDSNVEMVRIGQGRKLQIAHADAIAHLAASPDGRWDAVTCFQFVEHLPRRALFDFVRQAHRVLAPGGLFIVETLNPNTWMAHKWFALDLTHEHLVFPQVMEVLMESAGFVVAEQKGVNEVAPWDRLVPEGDDASRRNIDRLNEMLFGFQDYYIMGRKPAPGNP